ncbi:MAG: NblA/ycf18 family protein [Synechocystis sp.]|nr:NblA/ycf18 family protein [Synechocystis sp.]
MMNNDAFNLSMEQKFQLQCLQQEYQDLDREQTVNFLLETMQQIMVRDNLIRDLMKKSLFS